MIRLVAGGIAAEDVVTRMSDEHACCMRGQSDDQAVATRLTNREDAGQDQLEIGDLRVDLDQLRLCTLL
jgi:hypothetical protein